MFAGLSLHRFKPLIALTEGKTSGMSAIPALVMVLVVTLIEDDTVGVSSSEMDCMPLSKWAEATSFD